MTKYDQLRHKLVDEKTKLLKLKQIIDLQAIKSMDAREALENNWVGSWMCKLRKFNLEISILYIS